MFKYISSLVSTQFVLLQDVVGGLVGEVDLDDLIGQLLVGSLNCICSISHQMLVVLVQDHLNV